MHEKARMYEHHGELVAGEEMRAVRKIIRWGAGLVLGSVLGVSGVTAAQAGMNHSVGGGIWNHFVDNNGRVNASEYLHHTKYHRASVENPTYGLVRHLAVAKKWASAYQRSTLSGNKAYWANL